MPTHQYQVKDQSGIVRICNEDASAVTLPMNGDGRVEPKDPTGADFIADELAIYYIDNDDDFTLTITGTNPTVDEDNLVIVSGDAPAYSWSTNAVGHLVMIFSGPPTNGSEAVWVFSRTGPPLHVKVRIKRQTTAISCE